MGWALALVLCGGAVMWLLERGRPRARWVAIEGPGRVQLPGKVRIRLRLLEPVGEGQLRLHLRWAADRQQSGGVVVGAQAAVKWPLTPGFEFDLKALAPPGVRWVYALVWISPDGRWTERTHYARTDLIPVEVRFAGASPEAGGWTSWAAYVPETENAKPAVPRSWFGVRWLAALLFLGASLRLSWLHRASRDPCGEAFEGSARAWVGFAVVLAVSAAVEATDLVAWASGAVRDVARARGWYAGRVGVQHAATVLVLVAGMLGVGAILRRRGARMGWLMPMGWLVWVAMSLLGVLSLNLIDRVDATLVPGVSALHLGRLGAAIMVWVGSWRCSAALRSLEGRG